MPAPVGLGLVCSGSAATKYDSAGRAALRKHLGGGGKRRRTTTRRVNVKSYVALVAPALETRTDGARSRQSHQRRKPPLDHRGLGDKDEEDHQ